MQEKGKVDAEKKRNRQSKDYGTERPAPKTVCSWVRVVRLSKKKAKVFGARA